MSFFINTLEEKIQESLKIIKDNEPSDGYVVSDSGGKDSGVIVHLAKLAGVRFVCIFYNTTIEHPLLYKFLRTKRKETIHISPKIPYFELVEKRGLPSRRARFCCDYLKKASNDSGRVYIIGIRTQEGSMRKRRYKYPVETCHIKDITKVYPILNWTVKDVWDFHKKYDLPYCELYDKGFTRLGCIGCCMTDNKKVEIERYPWFKKRLIKSIDTFIHNAKNRDSKSKLLKITDDAQVWYEWWVSEKSIDQFFGLTDGKLWK